MGLEPEDYEAYMEHRFKESPSHAVGLELNLLKEKPARFKEVTIPCGGFGTPKSVNPFYFRSFVTIPRGGFGTTKSTRHKRNSVKSPSHAVGLERANPAAKS